MKLITNDFDSIKAYSSLLTIWVKIEFDNQTPFISSWLSLLSEID